MIKVDYRAQEAFLKENREQYEALVSRFVKNDDTLTQEEIACIYYASPFAGIKRDEETFNKAECLYSSSDYREAFELYMKALEQNPCSMLILKKAANCCYFGAFEPEVKNNLCGRLEKLHGVVMATGDAQSVDTAIKLTHVCDEYEILYNVFNVGNVLSQSVAKTEGADVFDEMTIQIPGEPSTSKLYFSVYGETENDMQDFFERKKAF